jgi:ankyrin repeat protein
MLLEQGADPNRQTIWHYTPLQNAMRRDNRLLNISLMLDHGGEPSLQNLAGHSATAIAAHRGRGDVLRLLTERGIEWKLDGIDRLVAACAVTDRVAIHALTSQEPGLLRELLADGGRLLAEFAGNGNAEGVQCLLDLGVKADALFHAGDGYWDLAPFSTALHSAAWRMWPETVNLLIQRGAPVNARDAKGRTALMLAAKACVDSYWKSRRSPEPVKALLDAGATTEGIDLPSGYDEVDRLLFKAREIEETRES